ncbi:MAG: TetR/AcrR family transcriptional regulator [Myxococcota bacterium]
MATRTRSRRAKIEAAAADLFSRFGFAATSTKRIATKAGVAEGTIFRHFPTKQALLDGLVDPLVERFVAPAATESLDAVLRAEHVDLEAYLSALLEERVRLGRRHPKIARIFLQELWTQPRLRKAVEARFIRHAYPKFERSFAELRQRGWLSPAVPDAVVLRLIMSTVVAEFVSPCSDPQQWAALVSTLARGLAPADGP